MNLSQTLARHIAQIQFADLPSHAVLVAKSSLLDALGVMLAASTLGEGCQAFVDLAIAEGGNPESTILGSCMRVPASRAAFANGALAHALDFEDAYDGAPVHPNAAVIPAALAVAESLGNVSGDKFLTAIILGSDLVCRLGVALSVNPLDDGWYIPPILSAFGATAAVAKLLDLSADQIIDAFSLVLCQTTCSAELTSSPRSTVRSIRDAFAAQAGVTSAYLAKRGVIGFEQPLEGRAGLFSLYARGQYDPAKITTDLGRTFENANVSFKPWPSCRGTHAYIDAVFQLAREHTLDLKSIRAIHVVVHPVNKMLCEPLTSKQSPQTAIDAKFSIPFVIATALTHGQVTLAEFSSEALIHSPVLALAHRVNYQVDATGFENSTQGLVQIVTADGTLTKRVEISLGHPRRPLGEKVLIEKFKDCARHSAKPISDHNLAALIDRVMNLEQAHTIGEITARL